MSPGQQLRISSLVSFVISRRSRQKLAFVLERRLGRERSSVAVAAFAGAIAAPFGPQAILATFAGAFFLTNTFLSASAQSAALGRTLGASLIAGGICTAGGYFTWGTSPVAGALIGVSAGTAQGAAVSAILGGSSDRSVLSEAIGMAILGGVAGWAG